MQPDKILDLELCLFDVQPPTLGGLNDEFVFSPRLDNQFSSFCAVEALAASAPGVGNVNCIALFNHEEIGTNTLLKSSPRHADGCPNRFSVQHRRAIRPRADADRTPLAHILRSGAIHREVIYRQF